MCVGKQRRLSAVPRHQSQPAATLPVPAPDVAGHDAVFVRTRSGFGVRHVAVGSRGAGRASIISGLNAGESIATRNAFLLKAELGKGAEDEE